MKKQNKIMIVPDMPRFVREVSEYGNIGAIVRRVIKLPLPTLVRLAWINKYNVLKLAKKDFASGVILLTQIELLAANSRGKYVAISSQVVDLSVALSNKPLITGLVATVRELGHQPVLSTNNLAYLLRFLRSTKVSNVWYRVEGETEGYDKLLEPERLIRV